MLTTQNLTQLAASLRNDPNPYQDLRLGVGPQPLRDTSQMEPLKYRPPADGGGKKGSKKKKSGGKKSGGKKGGKKGKKKKGKVDKAAAQAHVRPPLVCAFVLCLMLSRNPSPGQRVAGKVLCTAVFTTTTRSAPQLPSANRLRRSVNES